MRSVAAVRRPRNAFMITRRTDMGWLWLNLRGQTTREYLDKQLTYETEHRRVRVLGSSLVQRATYYAAVEIIDKDKGDAHSVTAAVCLVKYARGEHNFGYKDMDESMGPCEAECPARILDLLTPTDSQWANEWRARCRARLAKPKPKRGQSVTFKTPIRFVNGDTFTTLTFEKRNTFQGPFGGRYCVANWRNYEYTLG
jgi:hypothetical protein